jgi:radical SAM superfamily enzyme YgiQ (UPF0313 family)
MKILFVYPGYESLGVEYLSASLKSRGHQTSLILDPVLFNDSGGFSNATLAALFKQESNIMQQVRKFTPDAICFSVTSDNFRWAIESARSFKKITSAPIVFGGIHATAVPEAVLKHDCVDYVVVGEGEEAIVELAEAIERKQTPKGIKNVCFKDNEGGYVLGAVRPLLESLDRLPFPDKMLYYKNYSFLFSGYTIMTSRGCPGICSYCGNSFLRRFYNANGSFLRRRSVENVMRELETAKDLFKPKYIHFLDEVFTHNPSWLENFICQYRIRISLPFMCYVSPQYADKDIISLLKSGGCYKIQMGVQCLNEPKREEWLKRFYGNERIAEIIKACRTKKIYLTCDNIFGLPGQNEDDLIESARFYADHRPDNIEIFWLRYYPGTDIVDKARAAGYIDDLTIDRITKSWNVKGIARGGDTFSPALSKFQLFFNLYPWLPRFLRLWMTRHKIYRYFPSMPPILLTILFRFFNRARFDHFSQNTVRRYTAFFGKGLQHRHDPDGI